jgi:hypothetical protein
MKEQILAFENYLCCQEKSPATQEKYVRDMRAFFLYSGNRIITKELVISYKKHCMSLGYAVRSINSMIASLNSFLILWDGMNVKLKASNYKRKYIVQKKKNFQKKSIFVY